jgi:hypothetical protein
MPEPISLAHIKPGFLGYFNGSIKVCSTLELLLKPRIRLQSRQKGCELFF